MANTPRILKTGNLSALALAVIATALIADIFVQWYFGDTAYSIRRLHEFIEYTLAFIYILTSYCLYVYFKNSFAWRYLILSWVFMGIGGLSLLQGFMPDRTTAHTWLYLQAGLYSGIGFISAAILGERKVVKKITGLKNTIRLSIIIVPPLLIVLSSLALRLPHFIRQLIYQGRFLPTAIYFNFANALLFFFASLLFWRLYKKTSDMEYAVFFVLSLFFSQEKIMYARAGMWTFSWWLWQLLRLGALFALGSYLIKQYAKSIQHLRTQVNIDISQRKEIEKTQRLAQLGALVADMAHEVNNPLMIISGTAQLCLMEESLNKNLRDNLKIIFEECKRTKGIVERLLKFSRPSKGERKEVNINEDLEAVLNIIEHPFKLANIEIERNYLQNPPYVWADQQQMQEVFFNLLNNAREAMPNAGKIKITTAVEQNFLKIELEDTGTGISDEVKKRLFEPFFTTKEKGTGLGLAVCYGIIEAHNGKLKFESKLQKGTTVTILLPAAGVKS